MIGIEPASFRSTRTTGKMISLAGLGSAHGRPNPAMEQRTAHPSRGASQINATLDTPDMPEP
jgi:hypothetical protein